MSKLAHIQQSFDAGLLSPRLAARDDLAKYHNGCSVLENFIPTVQGPLVRRAGTRFIAATDGATRSWLIPFQVSGRIAYMLEFAPHIIRVYAQRGVLLDGGTPVVIDTPFEDADLTTPEGTCAISVTQSADVMYLFCRRYAPQKLARTGATTFTLGPVTLTNGPFDDLNPVHDMTVSASAVTGPVTLNASSGIFTPAHTGSLFYLQSSNLAHVRPWAVYQAVNVGDLRRVNRRVYVCTATGGSDSEGGPVTGNQTPVHTEGRAWDGDGQGIANDQRGPIGVEWEFLHAGYGIVRLDSISASNQATGTVVSRLPDDVVDTPSDKWAHGLFSDEAGWPDHGVFWRNRLVLLRDTRLALSVAGDFENFSEKIDGEVQADASIVQRIAARQINRPAWIVDASDDLVLGTGGDEWVIGPIQPNQPLGPENIRAERITAYGSRAIEPVQIGGKILFVPVSGRVLRDYEYSFDSDNYASHDLTRLSEDILSSGAISMAWQKEPDDVLWLARADGVLAACTLHQDPGVSDIYAWHLHRFANGHVECVATMPAPDGAATDLWLIVRRQINGQTVRYVEILHRALSNDGPQADAFYVDCALSYSGEPVMTLAGLNHLEGQTVQILTDGAVHPDRIVAQGTVTLEWPASTIHAGLPAPCRIATMGIAGGSQNGTAQGKTKRVTNVKVRVHRTLGGALGSAPDKLETLDFRHADIPMGSPPELYTGEKNVVWPGGYESESRIWYINEQPLPVTLLAFMPMVAVNDDR